MLNSERWATIEREALEQVRAELAVAEVTPLEFGAHLVWTECLFGRTNGLSPVHRVGFPQFDRVYTTCGDVIPEPIRWVPLSPAMVRTMARCKFCEAEYQRVLMERAA
jgi:hypothetical protein